MIAVMSKIIGLEQGHGEVEPRAPRVQHVVVVVSVLTDKGSQLGTRYSAPTPVV